MRRYSANLGILLCVFINSGGIAHGWEHYGGDEGGSKFSPLTSITPANVAALTQAWQYQTGETGEGYVNGDNLTFQATPIYWNGLLYVNSSFSKVYAVDAGTGEERWRFDAEHDPELRTSETAARGVSLWHDASPAGDTCAHRIFFGTLTGQLIALDALTGIPCANFGNQGRVDLTLGVGEVEAGEYLVTSPPAIFENLVIVGSAIGDNRQVTSERGIVRAIDARTGDTVWHWDPIPRDADDPARNEWAGDSADVSGGANAWAPLSVDSELGLVYVPTSAPSPDFYGGHRAGDNRYSNSVVALNARTGKVIWHQQLTHHDVWDYDTPAQPVLVDLDLGNGPQPAVVQATKTGMVFVFDRRTGAPLVPVEERPVPTGGVEGEILSPTQPFSTLPATVPHRAVTADDAFGIAWFDKRGCRKIIEQSRSEGIYTPPGRQITMMSPGYGGGSNWGGVSVDSERGIVVANVNLLPMLVGLVPRSEFNADDWQDGDWGFGRMTGTPYVMVRRPFLSSLGLPCVKPPWGKIMAIDVAQKTVLWEQPLGTIADLAPAPVPNFAWGVPNMGGNVVTRSGIIFIGAAAEHQFRAFDTQTGELLWQHELPRAGMATPMTYEHEGVQYVAIAAGGHAAFGVPLGDFLVAFKLP